MRFGRIGAAGSEIPVLWDDGRWFDLRTITDDIDGAFLASGIDIAREHFSRDDLPEIQPLGGRIGAPLARPGKIICIGVNYADHAVESGMATPDEPVVFMKDPGTIVGPHDEVLIPPGSTKTDWEVELGVVIGAEARYLRSPDHAIDVIAGYVLSHDVSEREYQLERGGQWDKGKSCDTFNPLGPVLVTRDEVPDPQALGLRLWVNGTERQKGSTSQMVFGVNHIVWYLSQFMVLRPGDLINTGTPAGVALGLPDQPYLRAGDVVELEIDGLGRARNLFIDTRIAGSA
ncbi:fumarylacetoacetate hydrolase family protein [Leifsonia sp. NPDC077715]|uniref:fumarylacetoacetate hydrolase family protein n=1 Tax=Leifsonia sp. NPDC077715 TaxID=3155539 RepID=UPI003433E0E1